MNENCRVINTAPVTQVHQCEPAWRAPRWIGENQGNGGWYLNTKNPNITDCGYWIGALLTDFRRKEKKKIIEIKQFNKR
jgi:hypothetical protein